MAARGSSSSVLWTLLLRGLVCHVTLMLATMRLRPSADTLAVVPMGLGEPQILQCKNLKYSGITSC